MITRVSETLHNTLSSQQFGLVSISFHLFRSAGSKISNGTGVGLRNVEARLQYLYSGDASLRFTMADNHIATASLTFPAFNSLE
jgi:sensor histidine kinase YesM